MPRYIRNITKVRKVPYGPGFEKVGEPLKTYRPTRPTKLDIYKLEPDDDIIGIRRSKFTIVRDKRLELEARAVSQTLVLGSVQERIVYAELKRRGIPFDFQSSFEAGRTSIGGVVADFVLRDKPIIIEVLGRVWHSGFAQRTHDLWRTELLMRKGYVVYELWEETINDERLLDEWFERYIEQYVPIRREGLGFTGYYPDIQSLGPAEATSFGV